MIALWLALAQTLEFDRTLTLTTDADGGGARPEIVHHGGRLYVVYLAGIAERPATPEHRARTYASDAFESPVTRTLVAASTQDGNPTDVRVAHDGDALYVFWEQVKERAGDARLFAARFRLGEDLTPLARPEAPIATAPYFANAEPDDELVNDPAPLCAGGKVFIMTRLKGAGPVARGDTIYVLRELDPETLAVRETRRLDLSDAMDGAAQVSSLVADGSHVLHVQASLSATRANALDLVALRMDAEWRYDAADDLHTLTSDPGMEFYPTGARLADGRLYVVHEKPSRPGPTSFPIQLRVFDADFRPLATIPVTPGGSTGSHATVEVVGRRVFVAYGTPGSQTHGGAGANVAVNVYEWR